MTKKLKKAGKILKRVIVAFIVLLSIFLVSTSVWNKILCIKENKALSKVGDDVFVKGKNIRVSLAGEGDKTIVLLSGMGTPSPIIDFRPLANKLSKKYRVVTLEYTGNGLSDDSSESQTNQDKAEEIRSTLKQLKIKPPYILMPHSISGIYCLEYMNTYPEEVEAMIGIDSSVPNQMKNDPAPQISKGIYFLAKFMDVTGLTRLSNRSGVSFIQEMENSKSYSKEDIKNVTALVNQRSITKAQYSENKLLNNNGKALFDVKYPKDIPVLQILSSETCKSDALWIKLHEEMNTNLDIQKIEYLEGPHYLQWTQSEAIAAMTKEFISGGR
jgi:pimeloyl-ACP methyl ester carboxylesterase